MGSKSKPGYTTLPLSRVRTIMRSSPEVSSISPDAIALTSHSAQLFISQLVSDAYNLANSGPGVGNRVTKLEYHHLSQVVATNPRMAFLQDILPAKVKVKDYRKIVEEDRQQTIKENCSDNNRSEDSEEDIVQND